MEAQNAAEIESDASAVAVGQPESVNHASALSLRAGNPPPTHCPYRRTTDLLQRLAPNKMRVGFLIGAGCSLSVHDAAGKPLIPDIDGLTAQVKRSLDENPDLRQLPQDTWQRMIARGIPTPTVEDALSHIRALRSLCGDSDIDGFSGQELQKLDLSTCEQVRQIVSKALPTNDTAYHALASWVQAIPRERPVELFTTNYDLSLEQALEERLVPYFDGFVGSDSAFLDLDSMLEDDLPPRWARLWKIHGSINWWMTAKQTIRRSRDEVEGEQLLIYPSHLKYDQSRQMPYYAMLDRLRVFLRSDQCVLVACGYSFGDEHINAVIGRGLSGNSNAACLAMIYKDRSDAAKGVELAKRHGNFSLLATDGGVIGTVDADWDVVPRDNNPAFEIAVGTEVPVERSAAPRERQKWLLGDFSALGRFLAYQLSSRNIE